MKKLLYALVISLCSVSTKAQVCFSAATNFAVGNLAEYTISADFNGDGNMDLVTVNYNSGNISVLIGNGLGSFATATNFAVGSNPLSASSADFNGDGKMDLAIANSNSNNTSVLIGNGLGSFSAATNFAVGSSPRSVISADFNGDGNMDLATANDGSNYISVLLGNGSGSFALGANIALLSGSNSIDTADFNGDGKMDLAVTDYNSNGVSVILGNGNGTFSSVISFVIVGSLHYTTTADFNGDGKIDLATANYFSNNASVLLNNIPNVSVTVNGITLTANQNGATYQWIDCNNGNTPISGQTNQSFTAIANGNYAVIVTQNSCSDTSICYNITTVGINESVYVSTINVFPNPSIGKFTLEVTGDNGQETSLEIYNILGEKIYTALNIKQQMQIDLSALPKGIYFVKVYGGQIILTKKIVIQ